MSRYKNLGFWIGIIGVVLTAMNIDINTATTWSALGVQIVEAVKNPSTVIGVIMALTGVYTNPTTKGIGDGK